MKTCNLCQQTKPLEEFHRDKGKRDGRRTICKECDDARFAKWYAENRERALAQDDKCTRLIQPTEPSTTTARSARTTRPCCPS